MSLESVATLRFEDRFNDLEIALLKQLDQHNVSYLLIGSVAAAFYGARAIENSTKDMDFLYLPSEENSQRLFCAIEDACRDVGLRNPISDPGSLTKPKLQVNLPGFYCEFLSARLTEDFEQKYERAIPINVHGNKLKIAAIGDLIEMKRLALSMEPDTGQKHLRDIENLLRVLPSFTPPAA